MIFLIYFKEQKNMSSTSDTIVTYTKNSLQDIIKAGCDRSWVLNQNRAKTCKYLVCCHSQGAKRGNAFLVAHISRIRLVDVDEGSKNDRWAIDISQYASVDIPDVWEGWRNPVHYTSSEKLKLKKIDLSTIDLKKLPEGEKKSDDNIPPLTLEQAKQGLAKYFNISTEQIKILING